MSKLQTGTQTKYPTVLMFSQRCVDPFAALMSLAVISDASPAAEPYKTGSEIENL